MNSRNGLRNITPVNTAIIIINVITFIVLEILGDTNSAWFMYEHGAAESESVMMYHEYWRLITCMFMHFGIRHLVNNMIVLAFIGDNLERAVGKLRYLVIYLGSGFLASAASAYIAWRQGNTTVSAGASGAIFGVVGALIYVLIAHRGVYEDLSLQRVIFFAVLSIYLGFQNSHTDNIAHLAGIIFGLILCIIVYNSNKEPHRT